MEAILVKVFATALALSQVTTRPDAVKTEFDPVSDQAQVVQILGDGCAYVKKAFDLDNIDLDDLIDTVMTDTRGTEGEVKGFRGLMFSDLHLAYRMACKRETFAKPPVDIGEVIEYYNRTAANLPDHNQLKGIKLPGMTNVLDGRGARYAEFFEPDNRRIPVPLSQIPVHVQKAFIAAEDKRFFEHRGVDERSVIRAFIATLADPKKRQGGSTITQQVAKNLLVGDAVTYERKIREIIVAARIEQALSKQEVLEIYLNAIFLGRASWGVEMAARSYFNKPAKDLTLAEGAFLAGLTKGPNFYSPDKHRERARERLAYVLDRMQEDGAVGADELKAAVATPLTLVAYSRPRRDNGYHLTDHIRREARNIPGIGSLTATSYVVRSTINPQLQRVAETALQDGLARYEQNTRRSTFTSAEANLGETIRKLEASPSLDRTRPTWLQALLTAHLPLYDVHWSPAIVVEKTRMQGFDSIRVGLRDGRVAPLSTSSNELRRVLQVHDVVYVSVSDVRTKTKDGKITEGVRVDVRTRPTVQGAVAVLENSTGRILAMVGGFSYRLSQLNRTTQSRRQPGSSLKPLTYLAALSSGLQPNTLIEDGPITLPPIGSTMYAQAKDWWSPKNYDGGYGGTLTLRRALENSKNLPTAHLLQGGIKGTPQESLDQICRLSIEAQLYSQCQRYYPFILGAQPVRVLDMAAFYASIANEGLRPTPYTIDAIERDGRTLYTAPKQLVAMASTDRVAAYQLKTILQGVLLRGTARSMAQHWPYVGGKTGTSDDENDAWFVGFSNDVTIAVWVGYDNDRRRRTLGGGQTGGKVAVPIFEPIMQAAWNLHAAKTPLRGPSQEAKAQMIALPIDLQSGSQISSYSSQQGSATGRGPFMEYFRVDRSGRIVDTQYRLNANTSYTYYSGNAPDYWERHSPSDGSRAWRNDEPFYQRQQQQQQQQQTYQRPRNFFDLFTPPWERQEIPAAPAPRHQYQDRTQPQHRTQPQYRTQPQQPRRAEPEHYWGTRRVN